MTCGSGARLPRYSVHPDVDSVFRLRYGRHRLSHGRPCGDPRGHNTLRYCVPSDGTIVCGLRYGRRQPSYGRPYFVRLLFDAPCL